MGTITLVAGILKTTMEAATLFKDPTNRWMNRARRKRARADELEKDLFQLRSKIQAARTIRRHNRLKKKAASIVWDVSTLRKAAHRLEDDAAGSAP